MDNQNKIGMFLVAIVAIVAVVGIVLQFSGSNSGANQETVYVVDEDGAVVGMPIAVGTSDYYKVGALKGNMKLLLAGATDNKEAPEDSGSAPAAETSGDEEDSGETVEDLEDGVWGRHGCPPGAEC